MTKIRNWVAAHGLAIFVALFAAIIVTFTIVISTIVNGYEARISELESKISGLESAYEELESSIGERFSTLEGRVESVEKTVSNLEKSVQKLEEADEKMLKEMEEIAKMISKIKAEAEVEETSYDSYEEENYYEEPAWVGSSEAPVVTDISSAVEKIETQETEDNASYEAEAEIREMIREEEITSDDVVVIPEEPAEPEAVEETVSEPEVVSETVVEETTEGTIEISGGEIDGGEIDESLDEYDWDSAPVVGVGDDGSMEVVSVELDM